MRLELKRLERRNTEAALTPERFVAVALLQLYGDPDPIHNYQGTRYHCDRFIMSCVKGDRLPIPNEHQTTLQRLCPHAPTINLYLSTYKQPDIALSLRRGDDGLFRISHHNLRAFKGEPPRDGVFMSWGQIAPPPSNCCGMAPRFERILRGGRAMTNLLAEVSSDYELRRQLTNWARLHAVLAVPGANLERLTVWHRKSLGKAVFHVNRDADPFIFTGHLIRPNAKIGGKFRFLIYGDAPATILSDTLGDQPRYFVPVIKNATHENDLPARTVGLLKELLSLEIMPVVGVLLDNSVDMYSLHWDEGSETLAPAFLSTMKLKLDRIPWFVPGDREHYASPNAELLRHLRAAFLEPSSTEATHRKDRILALKRLFTQFTDMRHGNQAILDYFGEAEMAFTEAESAQIASL